MLLEFSGVNSDNIRNATSHSTNLNDENLPIFEPSKADVLGCERSIFTSALVSRQQIFASELEYNKNLILTLNNPTIIAMP